MVHTWSQEARNLCINKSMISEWFLETPARFLSRWWGNPHIIQPGEMADFYLGMQPLGRVMDATKGTTCKRGRASVFVRTLMSAPGERGSIIRFGRTELYGWIRHRCRCHIKFLGHHPGYRRGGAAIAAVSVLRGFLSRKAIAPTGTWSVTNSMSCHFSGLSNVVEKAVRTWRKLWISVPLCNGANCLDGPVGDGFIPRP